MKLKENLDLEFNRLHLLKAAFGAIRKQEDESLLELKRKNDKDDKKPIVN